MFGGPCSMFHIPRFLFRVYLLNTPSDDVRHGRQSVVGIDAEWRPHAASGEWPVAVLQVSSRHRVFVIDMLALFAAWVADHDDAVSALQLSVGALWAHPGVVKAGFGLTHDVQRCCESYPEWTALLGRLHPVVHLDQFLDDSGASLSSLTKRVLGAGLDKTQQASDWQARPLTDAQLVYAALDARVLVQLYDVLVQTGGDGVCVSRIDVAVPLSKVLHCFDTAACEACLRLRSANAPVGCGDAAALPWPDTAVAAVDAFGSGANDAAAVTSSVATPPSSTSDVLAPLSLTSSLVPLSVSGSTAPSAAAVSGTATSATDGGAGTAPVPPTPIPAPTHFPMLPTAPDVDGGIAVKCMGVLAAGRPVCVMLRIGMTLEISNVGVHIRGAVFQKLNDTVSFLRLPAPFCRLGEGLFDGLVLLLDIIACGIVDPL